MPVASCANFTGDELDMLVANLEAEGNVVESVNAWAGGWKVLYHAKPKPGPKPREIR